MRAVIQRVLGAEVDVEGKPFGRIEKGLLVYLSVGKGDTEKDAQFVAEKIPNLRIFPDEQDRMNLSVIDVSGGILIVSNFTLHGNCQKGRRPGFDDAAEPGIARQLYKRVVELIKREPIEVQTGVFAAHMHVKSTNDGPVTFILESP